MVQIDGNLTCGSAMQMSIMANQTNIILDHTAVWHRMPPMLLFAALWAAPLTMPWVHHDPVAPANAFQEHHVHTNGISESLGFLHHSAAGCCHAQHALQVQYAGAVVQASQDQLMTLTTSAWNSSDWYGNSTATMSVGIRRDATRAAAHSPRVADTISAARTAARSLSVLLLIRLRSTPIDAPVQGRRGYHARLWSPLGLMRTLAAGCLDHITRDNNEATTTAGICEDAASAAAHPPRVPLLARHPSPSHRIARCANLQRPQRPDKLHSAHAERSKELGLARHPPACRSHPLTCDAAAAGGDAYRITCCNTASGDAFEARAV